MKLRKHAYIFLSILILFFAVIPRLFAYNNPEDTKEPTNKSHYDLLNYDITMLKKFDPWKISVFGVYLGMKIEEAEAIFENHRVAYIVQDKFNNNRYYLYDYKKENGKNIPLAYFKWDNRDSGLKEIIIYPGFARFLVGETKKLVTSESLNFSSYLVKNFLGYPAKKLVTLNVPSIQMKNTSYFYPDKNFQVIKQVSGDDVRYAFGIFDAKARPDYLEASNME